MTDKEKLNRVIAEIKRLQQKVINGATSGQYSSETIREKNQLLVSLLSFIDSLQEEPKTDWLQELQVKLDSLSKEDFKKVMAKYSRYGEEEPVSDDLEEAGKQYLERSNPDRVHQITNAFKAGAKWQKEQMMTKAIDAHCFGFQGAALFSFRLPSDNYLVGSKVKVIVINEG